MLHAARTPPPPDFTACDLLLLMLFRKLQNALDSFEVNVRSCKFSEVLCQFSAGILHWVWCLTVWRNGKNDTKIVPTVMQTEAKRVPKFIQNEPLWRISGFRVASRFQGPQKVSASDTF